MLNFFRRNIEEITRSRWLPYYGLALAITHVTTVPMWLSIRTQYLIVNQLPPSICWPFFSRCDSPVLHAFFGEWFLLLYFVLSLWTAFLFLKRNGRRLKAGYWLLLTISLMKWAATLQDFRLMGNYNYMQLIVCAVYLFLPFKEAIIPRLVAMFYFWAGTLKLNSEWLSGSIIDGYAGISGTWLRVACAYVPVLEIGFSWFLLSRRRRPFLFGAVQFALFHAYSFLVVGFYYPLTMYCLDSAFVFRFLESRKRKEDAPPLWMEWKSSPRIALAVLGIFGAAQMLPRLYPGDSALTAQGRVFALSMFDARPDCHALIVAHSKGKDQLIPFEVPALQPRIQCDPAVFFSLVKQLCREGRKSDPRFSVTLTISSKRSTEAAYHTIISESDFCRDDLRFRILGRNSWIRW